MVLLDLSAAFHTVDHSQLLKILCELGIRDSGLKWLKSYRTNRYKLYVSVKNHRALWYWSVVYLRAPY